MRTSCIPSKRQKNPSSYILLLPKETKNLITFNKTDVSTLKGYYMINLSYACDLRTPKHNFINRQTSGPALIPLKCTPWVTPYAKEETAQNQSSVPKRKTTRSYAWLLPIYILIKIYLITTGAYKCSTIFAFFHYYKI